MQLILATGGSCIAKFQDIALTLNDSMGTLTATYAFAIPSAAKYLTQFIDAHISWVNHVPLDMLSKLLSVDRVRK
jgi:hypothetical protein